VKKAGLLFVLFSLLISNGCNKDEDYDIILGAYEVDVLADEKLMSVFITRVVYSLQTIIPILLTHWALPEKMT